MTIIDAIKTAWNYAKLHWRLAGLTYFIQFLLVITLGMQVFNVLEASIGHSLEVNRLLTSYDHTVITDFLKVHGASITPLVGQLRWLLLVWILFSVFIHAGLLNSVVRNVKENDVSEFWKGASQYFFPFLKTSAIFLVLALLLAAITLLPIALFLQASVQWFPTEQYSVWGAFALLFLFLFGLAHLYVWSILSRLDQLHNASQVIQSIKIGWRKLRNHYSSFIRLLLIIFVLQILLLVVYWLTDAVVGMTTPITIFILFIFQQVCVFLRIWLRLVFYRALDYLGFS